MGNPVRPWKNFLTGWEQLDVEAQTKAAAHAARTLRNLRAYRKDIEARITYWEAEQSNMQQAKRELEQKGRSRERHERLLKKDAVVRGPYQSKYDSLAKKRKAII